MKNLISLVLALACTAPLYAQTKPRVEKAADLPRFTYKLDTKVEEVVRSQERFAPFAAQVRRDVESVVASYEIPDKATRRDLLGQLAALDFLDGQYDRAVERLEQIRGLQEKPADKLLSGLRLRAMARAAKAHGVGGEAYVKAVGEAIAGEIAPLPREVVENGIKEAKAGAETMGEGRLIGFLREVVQPVVDANGTLSSEYAPALVNIRLTLTSALSLKQTLVETYGAWLDKNKVVKADIWAAREVTLPAKPGAKPVVVAVWDSGVDTALFGPQVVRGNGGKPAFIAFDKYSRPAKTELIAISPEVRAKLPTMKARTKGFSDLQSNIDSPEAAEVKKYISTLTPEQYKAAIEELILMGNYEHGTHVAGIALAGNPQARLLVGRLEFGDTLKPDPCPSREQTERDAKVYGQTVAFFRKHGARVVNMSWGGSVGAIEGDLEQCGIGKTPEERKKIARAYFEIGKKALTQAMASAPEILFVTAAGNSNQDASFSEVIPAGIVLPNLLTIGAVDRAGDEVSFTSYGPTVKAHANGYQVESYLPGGDRVALSGTSMASPQVANLAGKILAVNPKLKPAEVIKLIVETGERTADGRRNLIHQKQALAAAGWKG
jgi:subtilisin family serine protease